jgi:hypothetical protein
MCFFLSYKDQSELRLGEKKYRGEAFAEQSCGLHKPKDPDSSIF